MPPRGSEGKIKSLGRRNIYGGLTSCTMTINSQLHPSANVRYIMNPEIWTKKIYEKRGFNEKKQQIISIIDTV